ncbi:MULTISPECIES: response regulator transcription factor [unclassified Acidovorax]|uniref:response regulator n=1 Tax=unclassified Acidovorax TaxID=2684926 RepID=UPI001C455B91|nr:MULTISPECIES: response regulator transcription factor [unclassified Acidovorax]MBV7430213.1 response regulator transcription factor [Acidovorax sp. sif0732]MBV7451606.1 response regulator transcription factor [Acidovorax sp. sif0715]
MAPDTAPPLPAPWPARLPAPLRVGVVEDDPACCDTFIAMIGAQPDLALAMAAASRAEALALLPQSPMDVLLVDLGLPDGSGLDVIRAARAQWPGCSVLVSTIFGDETHVLRSIEAGAMGYLLKDVSAAELAEEIRSIHAGGSPISPMVARKILARAAASLPPATEPPAALLSAREQEVLRCVSKGFTTEETARTMGVSRTTVLTFVRRIYAKLQVNTRAEAIHAAHRQGLLANG